MGRVVTHAVVSVDGFIATEHDEVGPLFDWLSNGEHPLHEPDPEDPVPSMGVSKASYDYVRPAWDAIGVTIVGRHLFDMTNGWEGRPPTGEHVVVVSHRPQPEGWHPEASYHFVDGIDGAVARARELAGDADIAVAAGDVGGQVLAAGHVDEVAMDVVPVVFGTGKRYFGSVESQHLLEDPDVVIRGDRVLHLRYRVRR
jgi:dihydrofolate reductase